MLIHIGGDTVVKLDAIIGIFTIHMRESPNSKAFIDKSTVGNAVEFVEPGEIKSCVVTDEKIYYSPISSITLKKRAIAMGLHEKFELD